MVVPSAIVKSFPASRISFPAPVILLSRARPFVIVILVSAAVETDVSAANLIDSRVREPERRLIPPPFRVIDFTATAVLIFGLPLLMIISSVSARAVCGIQLDTSSQSPFSPFHKWPPAAVTIQFVVPLPVV